MHRMNGYSWRKNAQLLLCFGLAYFSASTHADTANWNAKGELSQPKGYREWVFIGAPVTPNDLNNGKAAFPEFHNVYLHPKDYAHWKRTGQFREGTMIVKELVSVGGKQSASGNGYFMGEYLGLEAMVKDAKHFPDAPGNWGFFRFTDEVHFDPKAMKAYAKPNPAAACSSCHTANGQQDSVFVQHYPVLRAAKP